MHLLSGSRFATANKGGSDQAKRLGACQCRWFCRRDWASSGWTTKSLARVLKMRVDERLKASWRPSAPGIPDDSSSGGAMPYQPKLWAGVTPRLSRGPRHETYLRASVLARGIRAPGAPGARTRLLGIAHHQERLLVPVVPIPPTQYAVDLQRAYRNPTASSSRRGQRQPKPLHHPLDHAGIAVTGTFPRASRSSGRLGDS